MTTTTTYSTTYSSSTPRRQRLHIRVVIYAGCHYRRSHVFTPCWEGGNLSPRGTLPAISRQQRIHKPSQVRRDGEREGGVPFHMYIMTVDIMIVDMG